MRIIRDYRCSGCGATKEAFVINEATFGTDRHPHFTSGYVSHLCGTWVPELSPIATTFKFADASPQKHRR